MIHITKQKHTHINIDTHTYTCTNKLTPTKTYTHAIRCITIMTKYSPREGDDGKGGGGGEISPSVLLG